MVATFSKEVACLRQLLPALHLVEVDDSLGCMTLNRHGLSPEWQMGVILGEEVDFNRRTLLAWLTGGHEYVKVTFVKSASLPCLF